MGNSRPASPVLPALQRLPLLVIAAGAFASCIAAPASEMPMRNLRVGVGPVDGIYFGLATALTELLERHEPAFRLTLTSGSMAESLQALNNGDVDVAFVRANESYATYLAGKSAQHAANQELRAIAVIHKSVLHIVARDDGRVKNFADVPRARLVYGARNVDAFNPTGYVDVLKAALDIDESILLAANISSFAGAVDALASDADVSFVLTGFPLASLSEQARRMNLRFIEIDQETATRIRTRYPFYKPTLIPSETYPGQHEPITTIGLDNLIVTRASLAEDIVYQLTKTIFEWLPELAAANDTAKQIHPELAPTAPIPLHTGAARYFRERELLR